MCQLLVSHTDRVCAKQIFKVNCQLKEILILKKKIHIFASKVYNCCKIFFKGFVKRINKMAHLVVQVVERCEKAQENQHLGKVFL